MNALEKVEFTVQNRFEITLLIDDYRLNLTHFQSHHPNLKMFRFFE